MQIQQLVGPRVEACLVGTESLSCKLSGVGLLHSMQVCAKLQPGWRGVQLVGLHVYAWLTLDDGQACLTPKHALSNVAVCKAEAWVVASAVEQDAYECRLMTASAQPGCTSWGTRKGSC